jgi:CDP-diacylglycerol--serine O-phosphatidyltransferase
MSAINAQDPENFPATGKVRLLRRRGGRQRLPLRNRMHSEQLRKGVYLIPSMFTAGNIMCGFYSIILTFSGEYIQAALFIILANALDGVDGYAARLTKTTSQFGVEFDSLADIVSFGVAPAILVYFWALVPWGNWGWLAASTYVVCGALRLSRFNVQSKSAGKGHFVGLPIPAAAEMIVATVLMYYVMGGEGAPSKQLTLLLVIYGLALLMVSSFQYFSLKQTNLRKRHPIWVLVFGLIFIKVIIMIPQLMLFGTFLLYTLSGPLLWCWTFAKRRREKRGEVVAGATP